MNEFYESDEAEIVDLLVGRRIIQAQMGEFDYPGLTKWTNRAEGCLVLDDGTRLYLIGNDGCGGCLSGEYRLEKVAAVDNIITSARVECDPGGDDYPDGEYEGAYRIFVVADAVEVNVAEFVGSDGNGYYGTGFSLAVVRPGANP